MNSITSVVLIFLLYFCDEGRSFIIRYKQGQQLIGQQLYAIDDRKSKQRRPWELGRFVQQSSKFLSLPFLSQPKKKIISPKDVLWETSSDLKFGPLDDVVMGGVSSSTFDNTNGKWCGSVTDANNGGFIGIRSYPIVQYDMSNCRGIEIRLRGGEGKRFKFILRDSTDFNGITWSTSVTMGRKEKENKQDTITVQIPFEKQIPTLNARTVPGQTFRKSLVTGIQVAYSKFEYDGKLNTMFDLGGMELQILSIKAY